MLFPVVKESDPSDVQGGPQKIGTIFVRLNFIKY